MRDNQGKEVKMGQIVAYSSSGTSFVYTGEVIGFTNDYVKIQGQYHETKKYSTYLLIIKDFRDESK